MRGATIRLFFVLITFLFLIVCQINDAFGGDFCSAEAVNVNGLADARWTPDILIAGMYKVYVWWKADPEAVTDAPCIIFHDGGSTVVTVNQQTGGGQWYFLGEYPMDGVDDHVELTNNFNGKVIADAVKFVLVDDPAQEIILDNNDATYIGTWTCSEDPEAYPNEYVKVCPPASDVCVEFPPDTEQPPDVNVTTVTNNPGDKIWDFHVVGQGGTSLYYDISSNPPITGPMTVCINYDDTGLTANQEKSLKIKHWDGSGWNDETCPAPPDNPDTVNNKICACVDHLSWFAVGYEVSDVTCSLTPGGATVLADGSTLRFFAAVQNNTDEIQVFQFATRVTMPNGNIYPSSGWLLGPVTVTLKPHESKSKLLTPFIPYNVPFGTYTYHGYVGTVSPRLLYDQCQFNFDVTPY
jgi:hypothetical protein